jgi:hypothetical protein
MHIMSAYDKEIDMSTFDRVLQAKEPGSHRTRLEDLSPEGYRFSDEELKLVSGGKAPPLNHVTKPLIDNDPTGDTTNLGHKFLD